MRGSRACSGALWSGVNADGGAVALVYYEWSAKELEEPRLADLVHDGKPRYAWSASESHVWGKTPAMPAASRLLGVATGLRRRRPSYR